jgi:hypothetical protein
MERRSRKEGRKRCEFLDSWIRPDQVRADASRIGCHMKTEWKKNLEQELQETKGGFCKIKNISIFIVIIEIHLLAEILR